MKLMTLNTHSLVESSYEEKKEKFIETLIVEQPDVVALQEVNQTASAGEIPDVMLAGYKGFRTSCKRRQSRERSC